ncbi:hypothetical protein F5Y14DRAFT_414524 [Nemania sp. NC0429]|nr:hypothetical protein F5Y14DRAFT_414524 [Nemania sp. NC0429]
MMASSLSPFAVSWAVYPHPLLNGSSGAQVGTVSSSGPVKKTWGRVRRRDSGCGEDCGSCSCKFYRTYYLLWYTALDPLCHP